MAPRRRTQVHRVVERHAGKVIAVVRQLIPLLARHLASLTPNANCRVSEEPGSHIRSDRLVSRTVRKYGASQQDDAARWVNRVTPPVAHPLLLLVARACDPAGPAECRQ